MAFNQINEAVGKMGVTVALSAPTATEKKKRLTALYQAGIIRPSQLQWAIAVNGLAGH